MRALNTSLPRASPRRRRKPTPAELHQAFKSAALTVTQLYKAALADGQAARKAGYQDALDDLLNFLDQENMGLGDGEGWRVRQWATQHLTNVDGSDSDADSDDEKRARTVSPVIQTRPTPVLVLPAEPPTTEPVRSEPSPPNAPSTVRQEGPLDSLTHNDMFRFRSGIPFPGIDDTEMTSAEVPAFNFPPQIRLDSTSRSARNTPNRHTGHGSKDRGPAVSMGALGYGAGSKRKGAFGDLFDINNAGSNKDGHGNGKRGRHA